MSYYTDQVNDDKESINENTPNSARDAALHVKLSKICFVLGQSLALTASLESHFTQQQKDLFENINLSIDELFYGSK